ALGAVDEVAAAVSAIRYEFDRRRFRYARLRQWLRHVTGVKLPGIEYIAQGVAEHVKGQDRRDDRDTGEQHDPPVAGKRLHTLVEDRAPARRRLLCADAQIREAGLERDHVAHGQR